MNKIIAGAVAALVIGGGGGFFGGMKYAAVRNPLARGQRVAG